MVVCRRSYLTIPALSAARHIDHLLRRGAAPEWPDAIVFDLEDSVPVGRKSGARDFLHDVLSANLRPLEERTRVLIKVNAFVTPDFEEDLAFIRALGRPSVGIATAKTDHASELERIFEFLGTGAGPAPLVLPVIETLAGYDNREALFACAARRGVESFAFGAGDMSVSLGIERDYGSDLLRLVFCQTVLSSRRRQIGIVDSPSRVLPKTRGTAHFEPMVRAECEWARRNGAVGKIAIHPMQVPLISEVFGRTSEVEHAREVLRQFAGAADSCSLVDERTGEYMGTPSRRAAEELVRQAERRARRSTER